jgi:hypothetical protein
MQDPTLRRDETFIIMPIMSSTNRCELDAVNILKAAMQDPTFPTGILQSRRGLPSKNNQVVMTRVM